MARPSKSRRLDLWMNGQLVGHWTITAQGRHELAYAADWLSAPAARPLSLSLPMQDAGLVHSGPKVLDYFDNLLPDRLQIRRRLRVRFAANSTDTFDLLAEVGRDCAGALQLLPDGEDPGDIRCIDGEALTEAAVADILRGVTRAPLPGQDESDDFRLSIAGAQEKTALLWHAGQWHRPLGTTPTTHILKLPLGRVGNNQVDLSTSVENEYLCLSLSRAYGLPTVACEMASFEDQGVLIVTRFDRRLARGGDWWLRLPQEDFCQATGTPAEHKYEKDDGPGIVEIMRILQHAREPRQDRLTFFKSQVLFWLLAAPDGHAKNFSIFIDPEGRYRLTPLYDVISAHPVLGGDANAIAPQKLKLAMALHGKHRHYHWAKIQPRHWLSTAKVCGLPQAAALSTIDEIVTATPAVIEKVSQSLPVDFPASVADLIFTGVAGCAAKLKVLL